MSFKSSNAGYGDRSGEAFAQVVTTHVATVKVVNGGVVQAVIDDAWDELEQRETGIADDLPQDTVISPESAVNAAVPYITMNHDGLGEVAVVSHWEVEDLTPTGIVGSSTQRFTGARWTITVRWSVMSIPVYNVETEYNGAKAFLWEGNVDHRGGVYELSFELSR